MFRKSFLPSLLLILLLAAACSRPEGNLLILVSKDYDGRFSYWPAMGDSSVEVISMYTMAGDSVDWYLSRASGIIISGGPDVNPAFYGKEGELEKCDTIDYSRDTLELRMIQYAIDYDIPLLGICRGHQILNVAGQGSLIMDIPSDYETDIDHGSRGKHPVRIVEGTLLEEIVGLDNGMVNTSHHQAVERIAPGFRASAYAPDGIVEAIEPIDRQGHPFILGVQWHPETLIRESDSPLTLSIANRFMEEVHQRVR